MGITVMQFKMSCQTSLVFFFACYIGCIIAMEDFYQEQKFTLKQYKQSKPATCKYTLKFDYPNTVYTTSVSKVVCSVKKWPKSVAISYKKTSTFFIGNFSAVLTIKITKIQNKVPIKTKLTASVVTTAENKTSPWDLWCPAEGTMIWGDLGDPSIINDTSISPLDSDSYKECAKRCTEYENESGNKPCFSWVLNSNTFPLLDLDSGTCRLYGYKDVYQLPAPGVQAGYHKCYPAMQELGMV